MNIDKLLARFSIQTKVVVLVIPLIAAIAGLAAINLYTGSLLGGRLTGASASIETLSGFKEAYAGMNEFLQRATIEKRDEVIIDLDAQVEEFEKILALAGNAAESGALEHARSVAVNLRESINGLWSVHVEEVAARSSISEILEIVRDAKNRLSRKSAEVTLIIGADEKSAKDLLFAGEKIANAARAITTIVTKLMGADSAEQAIAAAIEHKKEIQRMLVLLPPAIPDDKNHLSSALESNLSGILDVLKRDTPGPSDLTDLKTFANGLRSVAVFLPGASAEVARRATARFSEIDEDIRKGRSMISQTLAFTKHGGELEVAIVRFLGEPTEERARELAGKVPQIEQDLQLLRLAKGGAELLEAFGEGTIEQVRALLPLSRQLMAKVEARKLAFNEASAQINQAWSSILVFVDSQRQDATVTKERATGISLAAAVTAALFALLAGAVLVAALRGPIRRLVSAMRDVAAGNLDVDIADNARTDEIGEMARALDVFKLNAIDKIRIEDESAHARETAARTRAEADQEKARADADLSFAVRSLGAALRNLSQGDLVSTIDTPFSSELDSLRIDFNESVDRMREAMRHIRDNAGSISANSGQLRSAADDLARRTEQQAASLEQTAAAVDEISATVSNASDRAADTDKLAGDTAIDARASGEVVTRAVDAMSRIEDASDKITRIIGVIDEIAFQTSLLALNAGVEAARAGDAGRGFAVVAQEVRELAGRSATAAKEIKGLIARSGEEVRSGVTLVGKTGEAITRIIARVEEISIHVGAMAAASHQQATGLGEVNTAVTQMDRMTQQNAAMVEETNAASHTLAQEAAELTQLVANFRLEHGQASARAA